MDVDPQVYTNSEEFGKLTGQTIPAWASFDVAHAVMHIGRPAFNLMAAFVEHYRSAPTPGEKESIAKGKVGEYC